MAIHHTAPPPPEPKKAQSIAQVKKAESVAQTKKAVQAEIEEVESGTKVKDGKGGKDGCSLCSLIKRWVINPISWLLYFVAKTVLVAVNFLLLVTVMTYFWFLWQLGKTRRLRIQSFRP